MRTTYIDKGQLISLANLKREMKRNFWNVILYTFYRLAKIKNEFSAHHVQILNYKASSVFTTPLPPSRKVDSRPKRKNLGVVRKSIRKSWKQYV